jgi:hypothetical protein
MQLQETTIVQWESVIADLTAKRQSTLTQLEQLRALLATGLIGLFSHDQSIGGLAPQLRQTSHESHKTKFTARNTR